MATFKCPACKGLHSVPDRYGHKDFICPNSLSQRKKFQNLRQSTLYTRDNWNFNEWSTREDSYRDVTVFPEKCGILPSDKNKFAGGTDSHNW